MRVKRLSAGARGFVALVAAFGVAHAAASKSIDGCGDKLIGVIDLEIMFQDDAQGRPACYPRTLMVTPSNGRVYIYNNLTRDVAPHMAGSHAAGWFLAEALKRSDNYTPDLDQADMIYVNDYCYWAWWLAWLNYGQLANIKYGPDDMTPGDYLVSAYQKLMQTPRWRVNQGADFIFFDGHPGFYAGAANHHIWPMRCGAQKNALQILVGLPQRRRCQAFQEQRQRLIVAPLMAPIADPLDEHIYALNEEAFWGRVHAELNKQAIRVPLEDRSTFLFFKGRCNPHSRGHEGMRMRNHIARAVFQNSPDDVDVKCLEDETPAAELFEVSAGYGEMRRSVFCLILPGQEQATMTLAEAYISGCVPIIIGPPWHSIPFAGAVAYNESAIFIKLEDTSAFMEQELEVEGGHASAHPQEARFWTPDLPQLDKLAVSLKSADKILGYLRDFAAGGRGAQLEAKLEGVWRERVKFLYHGADENEVPGAVQAAMSEACARNTNIGRPRVNWGDTAGSSSVSQRVRKGSQQDQT